MTIRVEKVAPPPEGRAIRVYVGTTPVAVFRLGGTFYAVDARCTHVGGPLDQGSLRSVTVSCPWHGSEFDLRDGRVVQGPALKPVRAYRVTADAQGLELEAVSAPP